MTAIFKIKTNLNNILKTLNYNLTGDQMIEGGLLDLEEVEIALLYTFTRQCQHHWFSVLQKITQT